MKTILNTLLLSAVVLCELPPPYSQRSFRPSPQFVNQFSSLRSPQTEYGPPKLQNGPPQPQYAPPKLQYKPPRLQSNTLDVELPSRLTIEQLIRLTEQLHSSRGRIINNPQTIRLSTSHNSYLPPPRQPQKNYGPPSNFEVSYSQFTPPPVSNFGISQPQNAWKVPQLSQQTFRPQNQYGPPPGTLNTGDGSQSFPQTTYGAPNIPQVPQPLAPGSFGGSNNEPNPQIPPPTNYGVPDLRSIETLGELRNSPLSDQDILRQNILNDLGKQHLPYKEPTGFRPQGNPNTNLQNVPSVNQQYLPSSDGSNIPQSSQGNLNNPSNIPQNSGGVTGSQGFGQGSGPSRPPNVNQQYVPASSTSQHNQNSLGNAQPGNIPSNIPQSGVGEGNIPQNGISGGTNPSFSQGGAPFGTSPSGSALNNGGGTNAFGQNYLPPQTTPNPVLATRPTTIRPRSLQTTPVPSEVTTNNYDYDYDLQSTLQPTESPTNQDGSGSDPNVSISNAVAGGGGFFYVQQPDGRLQRVILQKTQEPNSKPEEYVANYYFQNIQALPAVTYTPLVTVGTWK